MNRLLPALLIAFIVFPGCDREPPPPPVPEPPPPPTVDEIRSELGGAIQVLGTPMRGGGDIQMPVKDEAVRSFDQLRARHAATENGQEAMRQISQQLEQMIDAARENDAWVALKGAIQVYNSMNPGSDRYAHHETRADTMIARPRVRVGGFITLEGTDYVTLDVRDPLDPRRSGVHHVQVGEEFHERPVDGVERPVLKLVRVIGRNQAVEIEYLPVGISWEVAAPRGG